MVKKKKKESKSSIPLMVSEHDLTELAKGNKIISR